MPWRKPEVASVDDYLARLPDNVRKALEALRATIKAAAPTATETISYRIPAYRYKGLLVGFAAAKENCTFHLMSTSLIRARAAELARYTLGKGSIQFSPDRPLPTSLVRRLVKARIAENERRTKT